MNILLITAKLTLDLSLLGYLNYYHTILGDERWEKRKILPQNMK